MVLLWLERHLQNVQLPGRSFESKQVAIKYQRDDFVPSIPSKSRSGTFTRGCTRLSDVPHANVAEKPPIASRHNLATRRSEGAKGK